MWLAAWKLKDHFISKSHAIKRYLLLIFLSNWTPLITVKVSKWFDWRTQITQGFREVTLSNWHSQTLLSHFPIFWLCSNGSDLTVSGLGCSVTSLNACTGSCCIGLDCSTGHGGKRSGIRHHWCLGFDFKEGWGMQWRACEPCRGYK